MTPRSILLWAIVSLFTILLYPAAASADPITVTGGELIMIGRTGSMELTGHQGFSLTGRVDGASGVFQPWIQCITTPECTPGTSVSLRAFWSGSDVRNGILTFEGETYPVREIDGASVAVEFSGSFIAPPFAPSAVVTAPFMLVPFTPALRGSQFSLPYPGPALVPLAGSGMATINLLPLGPLVPGVWTVDSVRYDFSAEPVPEPGTLVLVGLGVAGAARRVTRARAKA
jgi:hypothetical protein